MDKPLYFYIEDGYAEVLPPEAANFYRWYHKNLLELSENKICLNKRYEDMTDYLYFTVPESFIRSNFPELLGIAKSKPFYPEHLDWKPENYGAHLLEPKYLDSDMADRAV